MCLTRDGLGKKSELVPGDSLPFDPCHSTALRQVLLLPFYRRGSGGPGRSSDCWHHAVPTLQSPARFYRLMHCQRGGPSRWGAWVDLGYAPSPPSTSFFVLAHRGVQLDTCLNCVPTYAALSGY